MNGYLIPAALDQSVCLPVALAQTEVLRGQMLQVAQIHVAQGQCLEVRHLTLHLIRFLTPGLAPEYLNTALGVCSLGLYDGPTVTSPLACARLSSVGTAAFNAFSRCLAPCSGVYSVFVSNNTSNIDLAVAVSGCLRLRVESGGLTAMERLGGVYA